MTTTITVYAVGNHRVQKVTDDGKIVPGRLFGRDEDEKPLPDGESVTVGPGNRSYLHRAIHQRKELSETPPKPTETKSEVKPKNQRVKAETKSKEPANESEVKTDSQQTETSTTENK